jgi:uncharacterized membrane protein YpjA
MTDRLTTIFVIISAILFSSSFVAYMLADHNSLVSTIALVVMIVYSVSAAAISFVYMFEMTANKEMQ